MSPTERLRGLGYSIDDPPQPSGPTLPVSVHNGLLYVAGQIPVRDGQLIATGFVGEDVDLDQACGCARQAVANALAHLYAHVGTLDDLRMLRMTVYVAAARGFADHSGVANAASQLLVDVLGERGRHSRTAIGVCGLPRHSPVEVDVLGART
ncbi:RidA family protein [Nonomuraea sp. NPDC048916]|uniref:RidA family protein n=1 Tax=Nonomuraea sp. NPDC048916 TaxID=3154232 RepID=UPI0033F7D975